MPKKRTQKTAKKHNQAGSDGLKAWLSRRKKDKWLPVVFVLFLLLSPFAYKQVKIYQEKQMYVAADRQITSFVNTVSLLEASARSIDRGCSRTSAKFEKGTLGCTVIGEIEYVPQTDVKISSLMKKIDQAQKNIEWKFVRDNTWNLTNEHIEIKNSLYGFKKLTCSVDYSYKIDAERNIVAVENEHKMILIVSVSCNGLALKEYY